MWGEFAVGVSLSGSAQAKITEILLVLFAILFAAILIHPEWDLPEVHDVKITSARHQSQCPVERPIQPVTLAVTQPLVGIALTHKWLPTFDSAIPLASSEPLLNVLRV